MQTVFSRAVFLACAMAFCAATSVVAQTPPAETPAAPVTAPAPLAEPAAPAPNAVAPPAAPEPAPPAPAAAAPVVTQPPPAAAAPAAPAAPRRLTGAAAIGAIAGNTLTGKIDGADNVIFFSNDGRMTMLVDSEQTQGKWELRGTEVCIVVEDEDDECYGLEVNGEEAVLREDATTSYRMAIAKGNVKNLPLGKR